MVSECFIVAPKSLNEALVLLANEGEKAVIVAGGVWVTLMVRHGLISPRCFVSLRYTSALKRVALAADGRLAIGAMATHRMIERAPLVRTRWPIVAEVLADVANVRVREQATLIGNLCEADPASDPPTLLAALDASAELVSLRGHRMLPVRDFVLGAYQTAREPDELVSAVYIPSLPPRTGASYLKFRTRSHEDRPALGVAAVLTVDEEERIARLEVVIGATGDRPQRVPSALQAVRGHSLDRELIGMLAETYAASVETVSDLRASAWYRQEMVRVFVTRALRLAAQRAGLNVD